MKKKHTRNRCARYNERSSSASFALHSQPLSYPICSGPWTDSDDVRLRKFMAPFVHDEHPPWPLISTRCNFGHNSGSCEKRWAEITTTKTSKWDAGKRFEFKGATGGGEVIGYKGQFSTPYSPV